MAVKGGVRFPSHLQTFNQRNMNSQSDSLPSGKGNWLDTMIVQALAHLNLNGDEIKDVHIGVVKDSLEHRLIMTTKKGSHYLADFESPIGYALYVASSCKHGQRFMDTYHIKANTWQLNLN